MEIREKNTFGDKVTSCLEHMCVIGSTDDMVCVLGNGAFTYVCVLASYADTSSDRLCGHTPIHTEKNEGIGLNASTCSGVCVCVNICNCHLPGTILCF